MSTTICHSFLQSRTRPVTQEAIRFKKSGIWNSLSWKDYYDSVERLASGLADLGVKKGSRVAIWCNTRPEWAMTDMAVLALGGIVVPVYQSSLPEEIEFIVNDSEATVLFCENPASFEKWRKISGRCPRVKTVICIDAPESQEDFLSFRAVIKQGEQKLGSAVANLEKSINAISLSDIATLVYTSGTTGQPKGVIITHEQIISETVDVVAFVQMVKEDRSLTFLPFAHVFGRVEHWAHVHTGFCMAYAESIDRIRDNLREVSPTFLIAVPRIFEKIYNGIVSQAESSPTKLKIFNFAMGVGRKVSQHRIEGRGLSVITQFEYQIAKRVVFDKLSERLGGRLRYAICGGAPLSPEIARFFHAAGLLIIEGYGLTETTAAVTANPPNNYRFGTVGKAIGDVQIKIAADGEILIKSKKVMTGYYKNEAATKEVMTDDGYFCTGDVGELTPDGFLRITDRKKDLIKTAGGKYVAPQKLENLLKLNKYVANVLIHGDGKKYIVALVALNMDEIKNFIAQSGGAKLNDAQITKEPKIRELIRAAVAETNSKLASFESIKNFGILPHDFTLEAGELTPSLKLKRKYCDKKYAEAIAKLYGEEPSQKNAPRA